RARRLAPKALGILQRAGVDFGIAARGLGLHGILPCRTYFVGSPGPGCKTGRANPRARGAPAETRSHLSRTCARLAAKERTWAKRLTISTSTATRRIFSR